MKKAEGSTEDLEGQQLAVTMASQHNLESENQKTVAIIKEKLYLFLVKEKMGLYNLVFKLREEILIHESSHFSCVFFLLWFGLYLFTSWCIGSYYKTFLLHISESSEIPPATRCLLPHHVLYKPGSGKLTTTIQYFRVTKLHETTSPNAFITTTTSY